MNNDLITFLESDQAEVAIKLHSVVFLGIPHTANEVRKQLRDRLDNKNVLAVIHNTEHLINLVKFKPKLRFLLQHYGQLLVDRIGFRYPLITLSEIELFTMEELQELEHNRKMAKVFFENAKFNLSNKNYTICTFMLHQSLEHALTALAIQHSGYDPATHNLDRLRKFVIPYCPDINVIFNPEDADHYRLFRLLKESYVSGRYDRGYIVDYNDCKNLVTKVDGVLRLI